MPANPAIPLVAALGLAVLVSAHARSQSPQATPANLAADLAGTWELAIDGRSEACRVILRAEKSDKGDYFLGMPAACRHAMPSLAKVGRWGLPDATHLTLDDPSGTPVVTLAAAGGGFVATENKLAYSFTRVGAASPTEIPLDGPQSAIVPIARQKAQVEQPVRREQVAAVAPARETAADLAGRYAVMREKHDTGCMLTLDDKTRGKAGGDRAQLAPGCRDQGIVIFDPVGWRLVKGTLVLTARAGHTTKLDKVDEGRWAKDATDGGKPLGLKRL